MHSSPRDYYTQRITELEALLAIQKKQLSWLSFFRISAFIMLALSIYLLFGKWQLLLFVGIGLAFLFFYLIHRYNKLKRDFLINNHLLDINQDEIEILNWNFLNRDAGAEFVDPSHDFSFDIDLYGRGSFFQYSNRTALSSGKIKLKSLLNSNTVEGVEDRQKAIKELKDQPEWRQQYSAVAKHIDDQYSAEEIEAWITSYKPFTKKHHKYLVLVFTVISTILIILTALQILGPTYLGFWLLLGLVITGAQLKKINALGDKCSKSMDTFQHYAQLINLIEQKEYNSNLLVNEAIKLDNRGEKASKAIKRFSRLLDQFDNRNNLISAIFGNGLFLYDLGKVRNLEDWIVQYQPQISKWFEVVHFFDAYNSLGNFAFNHPEFSFPLIQTEAEHTIIAASLGHPLIKPETRIVSDLKINDQEFFIVTGANMAGKSTFLRSVSLFIVMANTGLPVCAEQSSYHPIKLITSMRTSDSLTEESSYFFSELSRLKLIVDKLNVESYFIVLDEILKGTNSTDKAIGSKKFVERLVSFDATGIIATHDLSLCEAAKESSKIKNYYFDAEIIDDELHFDYHLKKGICQNMNASFLLKKMNIV